MSETQQPPAARRRRVRRPVRHPDPLPEQRASRADVARRHGFAAISDYAFLSDCRSAALVARDGSIDWLCWPRFDSPSIFAAILDPERGGSFRIVPTEPYRVERRYVEGTNVLQTTFLTASGSVRVNDWLHMGARQALCRLVKCLDGQLELDLHCDPRPDYGRERIGFERRLDWLVAQTADGTRLVLDGMREARERRTLRAGERITVSLGLERPGPTDVFDSRRGAIRFWRSWAQDLLLPDYGREHAQRSALVLKGLQYRPSGALIAAPTTSLPESVGGDRNWDYRFSWLRDSTFTLNALRSVGKLEEAQSYLDWLKMVALFSGAAQLQIMYGIAGEEDLREVELHHLRGHLDSRPVRTGNGAAHQRQIDTYGELADAIWQHRLRSTTPLGPHRWTLVRNLAERAAAEWREPDDGIWEMRGGRRHFVYSKVMCWVALDRAMRLARLEGIAGAPLERWAAEAEAIREQVLREGYDASLGAFTQHYGSGTLDASNLLLAQVGFIAADDPRFVTTVRATQRGLMRGGLVDRYRVAQTPDGFDCEEGTFAICTFWLVLALVEIGALADAEALFRHAISFANDLGLLAEEISPDGEQLGNFPQAFTHIAIIVCAFALDRALGAAARDDAAA